MLRKLITIIFSICKILDSLVSLDFTILDMKPLKCFSTVLNSSFRKKLIFSSTVFLFETKGNTAFSKRLVSKSFS